MANREIIISGADSNPGWSPLSRIYGPVKTIPLSNAEQIKTYTPKTKIPSIKTRTWKIPINKNVPMKYIDPIEAYGAFGNQLAYNYARVNTGMMGGMTFSPDFKYESEGVEKIRNFVKRKGGGWSKKPGKYVKSLGIAGGWVEEGAEYYKKSGGGWAPQSRYKVIDKSSVISYEELIPSRGLSRNMYGVSGGVYTPEYLDDPISGKYLGRDIAEAKINAKAVSEEIRGEIIDLRRSGQLSKKAARSKYNSTKYYFEEFESGAASALNVVSEHKLPTPGKITKDLSLNIDPIKKYGKRWVTDNTRVLDKFWLKKIKGLDELGKKELVARFNKYYLPIPMTKSADVALSLSYPEWKLTAGEAIEGGLGFKNPLDISLVSKGDITDEALSRLLTNNTLATGEIESVKSLRERFSYKMYRKPFKKLRSKQQEMVLDKIRSYSPVTGRSRWLWLSRESGYNFWEKLSPERDFPIKPEDIRIGNTLREEAFRAQQQLEARARNIIVERNRNSASVYYSSQERSVSRSSRGLLKRDAKRLQRARGREAIKVRQAMLDRGSGPGVPVGEPYGPAVRDLGPLRRMKRLARVRRASVSGGAGAAATQASSAITAINQGIKDRAMLPDVVRPSLLAEQGMFPLELRKVPLAGKSYAAGLKGTTHEIEVLLGGKKLGYVPYGHKEAKSVVQRLAGKQGGLINELMKRGRLTGYIESMGTNIETRTPWANMTILGEKGVSGQFQRITGVPVAGITFGEVLGTNQQATKKIVNRASKLEGFQAVKSWMAKVPMKWKVGGAIAGIAAATLLSRRNGRKDNILDVNPKDRPDSSLYGGATSNMILPEGMESERMGDRMEVPRSPMSYSARIEDPNAIQTNIRIKSGTNRGVNFEAVGRAMGLVASEGAGAELGNVNVRVTDDSRKMNDNYIERKIAGLM